MRAGLSVSLPARLALPSIRSIRTLLGRLLLACVLHRTDSARSFIHTHAEVSLLEGLVVAIMRRRSLAWVLLGAAAATNAAEPGNALVATGLDLLTVQSVQFDARGLVRLPRYRLTASIVPLHAQAVDTAPFGVGFSNASHLTPAVEAQRQIAWATNSSLVRFVGGDRALLSPRLRLESAGERLELIPRRHSVWVEWRKTLR